MTTLHALRRTYALSFSELATHTAVPVRRLAEFEYHGQPLSPTEHQSLAAFFGVAEQTLEGGFVARHVAQPALTQPQAQALAMIAAVAALAWSLRLGQPVRPGSAGQPVLAGIGTGAQAGNRSFNKLSRPLGLPTPTAIPTVTAAPTAIPTATAAPTATPEATTVPTNTLLPTATAEPTIMPTTTPSPTMTAEPTTVPTATPAPTATAEPTTVPTATPAPTATAEPTTVPTATPAPEPPATSRPLRASRLWRPTAVPRLALAQSGPRQAGRQQGQPVRSALNLSDETAPHRCPVLPTRGRVIVTQGYGVGTHAPVELWGGLDLAVAGGPNEGATVVAAHAGYVQVALDSWPGGNFVSISGDSGWRTGYAHLATVTVESGQYVQAGTPIGTIGKSGNTTGPHLHYESWYNGVNLDPSPRLFCR